MDSRDVFLAAVDAFAGLVARVVERCGDARWDGPGLGVWTLRDLVGHAASAGLTEVLAALDRPAAAPVITSPEAYYALARRVDPEVYRTLVAASTEAARASGASLGAHPDRAVRAQAGEVAARLPGVPADAVVETAAGGMPFDAWLPTRTFELITHGLDVADAAGVPAELPDVAVAEAVALAARVATAVGDGAVALRALTGRGRLPDGFSVV